ncbi:glycosyltransferase family 4 protein [Enterococcus sp.]|uniref:glycosyltransferase family 4 protein n=1 Tax=Enterococcus sp. TaxID=35783 RepID=UPI002FC5A1BA
MKVCFCSTFLESESEVITNSKIKPSVATHKFNLNILEGLRVNIGENLTIFNTENIASYPNYNKIIRKKNNSEKKEIGKYINIGKINLPVLKNISETINLYRQLDNWMSEQSEKEIFVCGYGRHFSHVVAINILKKKYKHIKTCMILADLGGNALSIKEKTNATKQKIFGKLIEFQVNESKKFDSFVLLTEAMSSYLNVAHKPYTVIEGICSNEFDKPQVREKNEKREKIIAYSGVLSEQYGVDILLDAFQKIEDKKYKLWLFGDGELKQQISKLTIENPNIEFFGYIPNKELRNKMSEATVLVNPRQNLEEFTKYSFPSKIIEYLTMAKPVIGYQLDGVPLDYKQHIFYVDDNSSDSLKNKIIEVCEYSETKRLDIGEKNLNFVITNKGSVLQTRKIVSMFKEMGERSDV